MNGFPDLSPEEFSRRWVNFSRAEFACRGTGLCKMDPMFLDKLQVLRATFRRPMIITSGYRDPGYNATVSKTGIDGPHTFGKAADIAVDRTDAFNLLRLALELGFTGIGVNQKGKARFLHLDTLSPSEASPAPRPTIWSY